MKLRSPQPDWQRFRLPRPHKSHQYLRTSSYFVQGLHNNISTLFPSLPDPQLITWVKFLSRHPNYESLFNGWQPKNWSDIDHQFNKKTLLPSIEKELAFTAFALDQFKERTERDGASLVILASHAMGTRGHAFFDHMNALAEARGIPVIDQYDYIRRQAGEDPRGTLGARPTLERPRPPVGRRSPARISKRKPGNLHSAGGQRNALIPRMAECGRLFRLC